MSERFNSPEGGVLRGIVGGVAGALVCAFVLLVCSLFWSGELGAMLQLFVGLAVGWFYRLFRGRRSKTAAYVTVSICTVLACVLWVIGVALLSVGISPADLTAGDWLSLWEMGWELLLLCAGLGLIGFFLTRKGLLIYADWKRGPWHMAYSYAGGAMYNLLPERLPAQSPPERFVVRERFSHGTQIIVEGDILRWKRLLRKEAVIPVQEIAGVVLGPSGGCNVVYNRDYRVLTKFAASMEHAELLLLWLLQRSVPIDKAPVGWRRPDTSGSGSVEEKSAAGAQRKFTLGLKRSARIGFTGIGWFLLVLGALLLLMLLFSQMTAAERWAIGLLDLVVMGMGVVYLRIGKRCGVEINGEQMRVVSRWGRTAEFSVREVSSVSRSIGWIVLYDREWRTLARIDPYLENLETLKEYLAGYGVKW